MKVVYVGVSSKFVHTMPAGWFISESLKESGIDVTEMYHNVNEDYRAVKESVLSQEADFYLLSAYIFNAAFVKSLIADIKAALPHSVTVVGGPEADESYHADYLVIGEGEKAILPILQGKESRKIIIADKIENLDDIPSPYTEDRISASQNKLIYYESTRGCPFSCSYCAAGSSKGVRAFSLSRVFSDLITIGKSEHVRTVKFTDRTFNADNVRAEKIITFIKENFQGSKLCFHFEVGGDLFSDSLLSLIASLPPGLIQLEAGVQTLNPKSLQAICRPFHEEKFIENIQRVREKNNVHLHLDLIAGLPYDTLLTFKESFNRVISLRPHKLQLGFLKMLKGTPIRESYQAVFDKNPPYEVAETPTMTKEDFYELKSVEKALDKLYNSGKFTCFLTALFENGSPYECFLAAARRLEEENAYRRGENAVYAALLNFYKDMPHIREYLLFDYLLTNNSRIIPHALKGEQPEIFTEFIKSVPRDGKSYYAYFPYHPVAKKEGAYILHFDYSVKNPVDGAYTFRSVSL